MHPSLLSRSLPPSYSPATPNLPSGGHAPHLGEQNQLQTCPVFLKINLFLHLLQLLPLFLIFPLIVNILLLLLFASMLLHPCWPTGWHQSAPATELNVFFVCCLFHILVWFTYPESVCVLQHSKVLHYLCAPAIPHIYSHTAFYQSFRAFSASQYAHCAQRRFRI